MAVIVGQGISVSPVADAELSHESTSTVQNKAVTDAIASEYSTSKTYSVGDVCTHDGKLYECIVDIPTAEGWTLSHWKVSNLGDNVSNLNRQISDVEENQIPELESDIYSAIYDVSGYVKYFGEDINLSGTAGASNSSCLAINRSGNIVIIDGGNINESRSAYQNVYIKLTGTTARTNNRNTVTSWTDGITLVPGHQYRVDEEYISGSTDLIVEAPPGVSVYQIGERSSIGTPFRNGSKFSRRFIAPSVAVNLVLYVPCANITYTAYKTKIVLVDETINGETPVSPVVGVEYSGVKIDVSNNYFTTEEYMTMTHTVSTSVQGGACYDKYYFQFTDTMDQCTIYDLDQKALVQEILMTGVSTIHCNNVNFGTEFYDTGDEFPLLYVSAEDITDHKVIVYRVTYNENTYGLTQVQTITWDAPTENSVYYPNAIIDKEANRIIQVGYTTNSYDASATNKLIYNTFALPSVSVGDVLLSDSDKIDSFTLPSVQATQGAICHNGIIIQAFGSPRSGNYSIRAVDTCKKSFVSMLDMNNAKVPVGRNTEIETVFVYKGNLYATNISKLIYKVIT